MSHLMKTALRNILLLLILVESASATYAVQEKGGREDASGRSAKSSPAARPKSKENRPTGAPTSRTTRANPGREKVKPVRRPAPAAPLLADLTINVTPPDSEILFDSRVLTPENGTLRLQQVGVGTHTINARKAAYRGAPSSITLSAGESRVVNIVLMPLPGKLNITPTVTGANITIADVGSYAESVRNLELSPGWYVVTITKSGYHTLVRNALVRPDELTDLVIPMELVPPKKPRSDAAMSMTVSNEGKFFIVSLTGASEQISTPSGSVEVTLDPNGSSITLRRVIGLLPGVPCRVDFVPLENVAEPSFKEPPGIHNQWRTVAVRIRPKDHKRAVKFSIYWQTLQ